MADDHSQPTNRLAGETSAYLRQHMHNPVDWYPWGDEAFERAAREGKPVLVSIGYSACHWCHVMAHESFEDPETAALMNELFVNVKVDREERPDVDQIYMDTVVRMTGHGGWPLTAFCTPEGRPFYAGTYYPKEPRGPGPTFRQLMQAVNDAWHKRRDEVEDSAGQIAAALASRPDGEASRAPGVANLVDGAKQLMQNADTKHGGFGRGPKFPTPTNLQLLLAASLQLPAPEADPLLEHCRSTAIEMSRRGLYDHLGGGFHRYCVDALWEIPHFEKMLYDNGLLLRVYAELYRRTLDDDFAWPLRETIAWLVREMRGPEGAFYASQDADSEGEEGRFYVWTPLELSAVLGNAAPGFLEAYGAGDTGNFEGGTTHLIDRTRRPRSEFAAEREQLRVQRSQRIPPATDSKRVAAWNGYTISGLARTASALDDPEILTLATRAADFVLETMRDGEGRLLRVFAGGRAHVTGFLDDHAAMLEACLDLHRAGAGDRYLREARSLAAAIVDRFYDAEARDLFLTPSDGERLVHRPRSDSDGATPHPTGQALLGMLRLAELTGDEALAGVARAVIATHAFVLERAPHAFPTLLRAAALADAGLAVAVVIGDETDPATRALAAAARRSLSPDDAVVVVSAAASAPEGIAASWLSGREALDGRPTAYVCRGTTCSLPITRPDAF